MAENKNQDGRHHSDDPTPIEELVRQVVASAAPHPNMPPLPYSLRKMKNAAVQLVSFNGPRSHDWSIEPGLTPLQIDALREIERLFLESRAYHKLLHGMYTTWREHRVEPRPSAGSFFKAVTPKGTNSFNDAHPLFKEFWGSHEGNITWSGEDVIPVMRELVRNLIEREAVVAPIPTEVVVVEDVVVPMVAEEIIETSLVPNEPVEAGEPDGAVFVEDVGVEVEPRERIVVESVENNLVPDELIETGEPNEEAAEVLEVVAEAQGTGASDVESDRNGDKENQPVSNSFEQEDSFKPIEESLVGARSLSSTNLVRDAVAASMPADESDLGRTNDISFVLSQNGSQDINDHNLISSNVAGTSDNVDTSVKSSSKKSISRTSTSLRSIEEEHSYAKSTAHEETDGVVFVDIISVLVNSTDLAVDHEEEVETTTFEIPTESSSKRCGRKRFPKLRSGTPAGPKKAKTAKVDSVATGVDEEGYQKNQIPVDLANQDGSKDTVQMDEPSAEPNIPENSGVGLDVAQSLGVKISQCSENEEDEVNAATISVLVSNLIDLVVRDEEEAEKFAAISQKNDEDQFIVEEVQLDEPSAQSSKARVVHQMFDGTEFDVPESYATALIPSSVELAPLRRRFVPRPAPPQTCPFFVIRNDWEMKTERRRALRSFANQPPIRPGTVEYKELLEHAQIVFDNSGFMEEDYLLTITPFLRKHFCDPFEKLEGDFPKAKIIVPPSTRKMCLEWIRVVIGGCKNRFSDLFTQWQEHRTDFYLEWVRLKKLVDELIFQQVQCRLITGEVGDRARMKKKRPEEAVNLEKNDGDIEPPPKRQCFWMS
ncbi:unnamed protein product [Caenorhabditis brenneri]